MRILLITGAYPPMKCGVGDYTEKLAEALGKNNDTTVAVITSAHAKTSPGNSNVSIFPVIERWTISDILRIFQIIRDFQPDIVHMQFGSNGYRLKILPWLLPALMRLRRLKVVQTWHEYSGDPLRIIRNLPNALIPGGLIVVKPNFKDMMHNWYRRIISHKNFKYIPNASAIPKVELTEDDRMVLRSKFSFNSNKLVAFFGFANSRKGVDSIFDIANHQKHSLIFVCDLNHDDPYHKKLLSRIESEPWAGNVTVTGFLPSEEVGKILAVADAVVLPFPEGGGVWSTSAQAAMLQGTFVVATSNERHGYDARENVYYAVPGDIHDMRQSLNSYIGQKNTTVNNYANWDSIAQAHIQLYNNVQ